MCVGDGRPPHGGGGLRWAGVGVTCSCAGPSAGGASPGAEPGSSRRLLWGLSLAPELPAAPSSGSSGTGCRSAPLPGWMGTVGRKAPGFGGGDLVNGPNKESPTPTPPGALSRGPGVLTRRPMEQTCLSSGSRPEGFPQGSTPSAPPGPQPAPCSCAPSAASAPTASSSPGPGSPAPPRLQSPGSPPRTRDLGTAMWPRCRAERDWDAVRKRPPCSQACGDGQPGRRGSASRTPQPRGAASLNVGTSQP